MYLLSIYSNLMNWHGRKTTNEDGFMQSGITTVSISLNSIHKVKIGNEPILLTRLEDDTIIAFTPFCPHAAADLTKGDLHRGRIICPDHDWKFDLRTGRTIYPPDEPCQLKRFPVQEIDGEIWIKI